MKFLLLIHTAMALCAAGAIAYFVDPMSGTSFGLGALLMLVDLVLLALIYVYVMAKKQFALSIGVIVFKFAIFAWIISEAVAAETRGQLYLGWFAAGSALINLSALAAALKLSRSAAE